MSHLLQLDLVLHRSRLLLILQLLNSHLTALAGRSLRNSLVGYIRLYTDVINIVTLVADVLLIGIVPVFAHVLGGQRKRIVELSKRAPFDPDGLTGHVVIEGLIASHLDIMILVSGKNVQVVVSVSVLHSLNASLSRNPRAFEVTFQAKGALNTALAGGFKTGNAIQNSLIGDIGGGWHFEAGDGVLHRKACDLVSLGFFFLNLAALWQSNTLTGVFVHFFGENLTANPVSYRQCFRHSGLSVTPRLIIRHE